MKTKYLFLLFVPVFIVIAIQSLYMVVSASHGIVKLSDEEIAFYQEAAIDCLNHEDAPYTSNTKEALRYVHHKDSVTVVPYNTFKETVTAYYENGKILTKVNEPNIDFGGCMIFFSFLFIASFATSIVLCFLTIDEFKKDKKKKAR